MVPKQSEPSQSAVASPPQEGGGPRVSGSWAIWAVGVFVAGIAVGVAGLYFGLERPALDDARGRIDLYQHELGNLRAQLNDVTVQAAALEGRLLVEESTRRGLETGLRAVQDELGRARDSIAFYEQLMPPGPKGSISVRALEIEPAGPNLKYRMLLMRSGSSEKPFQGELQFVAQGRLQGEASSLPLQPALSGAALSSANEADPDGETLAIEFSDFQRSSGFLGLPEGFVPDSVTVNVLEGRTLRASHTLELPKLD